DCFLELLPVNLLEIILKMPNLEVESEVESMSLIKNWINFDKPNRLKYLKQLYHCIHVPSLLHMDLDLVVGMFNDFGIMDERELKRMFTLYTSSPHKYLSEHPDEVPVRNGRDVIIMIGGVDESIAAEEYDNQNLVFATSKRLYYTDVETITEIFRTGHGNNLEDQTFRSSSRPTIPKEVKFRKMKFFHNLACPIGLVEFGICVFNNFIYIAGGQTKENEEDDFCSKSTFCLDPHIGEWTK
ncbi:hypothetical protein ACJMK2_014684, partial [Sinanodonta woodiana]